MGSTDTDKNDIVDKQYIDPTLTMPLPGAVGPISWDPAGAGHDEIPLAEEKNSGKPAEQATPDAAPETIDEGFGGFGSTPGNNETRKPAGEAWARDAAGRLRPRPPVARKSIKSCSDLSITRSKRASITAIASKWRWPIPTSASPNAELEKVELAQAKILETEWSEPTAPVLVLAKGGVSILAGPIVKPVDKPVHDPDVLICVITFDPARGGEPAVKKQVQRGAPTRTSWKTRCKVPDARQRRAPANGRRSTSTRRPGGRRAREGARLGTKKMIAGRTGLSC